MVASQSLMTPRLLPLFSTVHMAPPEDPRGRACFQHGTGLSHVGEASAGWVRRRESPADDRWRHSSELGYAASDRRMSLLAWGLTKSRTATMARRAIPPLIRSMVADAWVSTLPAA